MSHLIDLPPETLNRIFSYFPARASTRMGSDLRTLCKVSKVMKEAVLPLLYWKIDIPLHHNDYEESDYDHDGTYSLSLPTIESISQPNHPGHPYIRHVTLGRNIRPRYWWLNPSIDIAIIRLIISKFSGQLLSFQIIPQVFLESDHLSLIPTPGIRHACLRADEYAYCNIGPGGSLGWVINNPTPLGPPNSLTSLSIHFHESPEDWEDIFTLIMANSASLKYISFFGLFETAYHPSEADRMAPNGFSWDTTAIPDTDHALPLLPLVHTVKLRQLGKDARYINSLPQFISAQTLRKLHIEDCGWLCDTVFQFIGTCTNITTLVLSDVGYGEKVDKMIKSMPPILETLWLSYNYPSSYREPRASGYPSKIALEQHARTLKRLWLGPSGRRSYDCHVLEASKDGDLLDWIFLVEKCSKLEEFCCPLSEKIFEATTHLLPIPPSLRLLRDLFPPPELPSEQIWTQDLTAKFLASFQGMVDAGHRSPSLPLVLRIEGWITTWDGLRTIAFISPGSHFLASDEPQACPIRSREAKAIHPDLLFMDHRLDEDLWPIYPKAATA